MNSTIELMENSVFNWLWVSRCWWQRVATPVVHLFIEQRDERHGKLFDASWLCDSSLVNFWISTHFRCNNPLVALSTFRMNSWMTSKMKSKRKKKYNCCIIVFVVFLQRWLSTVLFRISRENVKKIVHFLPQTVCTTENLTREEIVSSLSERNRSWRRRTDYTDCARSFAQDFACD